MRRRAVTGPLLTGALALSMCQGCSPSDCTEKATCPDSDDATADATAEAIAEATADALPDVEAAGGDADLDADLGEARDAGSWNDASDASGASLCGGQSVCVDPVPAGWTGPLALFDQTGTVAPVPPSCPSTFPSVAFDGHADPSAPQPTCSCSCGDPANAHCSAPTVQMFFGACPGGSPCGTYGAVACTGTLCAAAGAAVATSEADGGACPPHAASNVPPWSWARTARACQVTGLVGACRTGVCVPVPPFPFASGLCIAQAGDIACPPSSKYSQKHLYYSGAVDGRGCTPCVCGAPAGMGCATGVVTFYTSSAPTCGGSSEAIPTDGLCHAVTVSAAGVQTTMPAVPSGGSCAPDGGQPTGLLMPTGAETVCCQP